VSFVVVAAMMGLLALAVMVHRAVRSQVR
jgi:hypothetical protein